MTVLTRSADRVLAVLALAVLIPLPALAVSAASTTQVSRARPAAGHWKLVKADSDGYEKDVAMTVAKGGKRVKGFALTPEGSCAGPRLKVLGSYAIKRSHQQGTTWYVAKSQSESLTVTVEHGKVKSTAALEINFDGPKFASVYMNLTSDDCNLDFELTR